MTALPAATTRHRSAGESPSAPVQAPPLHDLAGVSRPRRLIARLACGALVLTLRMAATVAGLVPKLAPPRRHAGGARVLLTGMFVSDSWVEAHVRPLTRSAHVERIWIVTDRPMLMMPKTTYVCAPPWLQRIAGRVGSRTLMCVLAALRSDADVVGGFHLVFNGMISLILARLLNARAMYYCVGGWSEIWGGGSRSEARLFDQLGQDSPWLERQLLWFVERMDLTLTMGSGGRTFLRSRGIDAPVVIMSGGIEPVRFDGPSAHTDAAFDLVFVGRLVPIKRPDVLLDVIARVVQRRPQTRAVIVGDGPLREEMELRAARLGISANVTFAGHRSDVHNWLRRSRLFVLTSDSEGLALSVIEAMTAGLPAVVSDVGDLRDLVLDGVNGFLPPRRDVEAFASGILSLLDDAARYEASSQAARAAASGYTTEAMTARWDAILSGWGFVPHPGHATVEGT